MNNGLLSQRDMIWMNQYMVHADQKGNLFDAIGRGLGRNHKRGIRSEDEIFRSKRTPRIEKDQLDLRMSNMRIQQSLL